MSLHRLGFLLYHGHKNWGQRIQAIDLLQLNRLDVRLEVLLGEAEDTFLCSASVDEPLPEFPALPDRDESNRVANDGDKGLSSGEGGVQQLGGGEEPAEEGDWRRMLVKFDD